MSIILAKDSGGVVAYSGGSGADPLSVNIILDRTNSPTSVVAYPTTDLWVYTTQDPVTVDSYSDITLSITGVDVGISWELSPNGSNTWGPTLAIADLDVSSGSAATQVYVRASGLNDGSIVTNNYTSADIHVAAVENPVL